MTDFMEWAREYASTNLAHKAYFALLDSPAGVITMASAARDPSSGRWCRGFRGTRRDVMTEIDIKVEIVGDQHADGTVVRYVEIDYLEQSPYGDIGCFMLGLADAQWFSKALVATLREIEHLGTDPRTGSDENVSEAYLDSITRVGYSGWHLQKGYVFWMLTNMP